MEEKVKVPNNKTGWAGAGGGGDDSFRPLTSLTPVMADGVRWYRSGIQ